MKKLIIQSFSKNLAPGIALWSLAVLILIAYFFYQPAQNLLNEISIYKTRYSYLFSAQSTALFGGLIPFLIHSLRREFPTLKRFISCLFFYLLFWAWKGAEIDLFYRFQGDLWGIDNNAATIAKKVAFDMLIFSALYAVPCIGIFNVWKDQNFNFKATKEVLTKSFFQNQILAMIVSNWMIWIPAVSVVYAMPSALQVVMFNLVLCFWVLIASMISDTKG